MGREAQHVLEVVGDQDDRRRHGPAHLVELVVQAASHLPVDGGEGLVQQQHPRLTRQGTRHRDALPFAPGQRGRLPLRAVGQVHEREQVGGARLALASRAMAQRGHDVLERGQVREERVLLEHEPDGTVVGRQVDAVRGVEPDFPPTWIRPSRGVYRPAIVRRIVVLPLPDGPKIASTSPGAHVKSTASRIGPSW